MKQLTTYSFLILFCFVFSIQSCSETSTTQDYDLEMGFEYYPLEVGKYLIYKKELKTYDIEGAGVEIVETTNYVKEELIGTTLDNQGESIFIIERFEKQNLNDEWLIQNVWTVKATDNRIEETSENIKLVKMIFPLQEGKNFDATLFVDENTLVEVASENIEIYKNWDAEILTVDQAENIGSLSFDNVTTISYADDENLIEKRYALSKYAKDIGLVYQEDWFLDFQPQNGDFLESTPWEEKARMGYILKKTLLEYN